MVAVGTILGICNWGLNFIATILFLSILITGIKYRRELRDVSLMLTYNTCLAALLACFTVCLMITSNLSNGFLTFNFTFCCFWGTLYDMFICSIYHSFYLQAFYRLCRVVFYKKKALLSYSLFIMLVIGQWSLTIVVLLPPPLLGWYVTLPTERYCLVPYTNQVAESYHIVIIYAIPSLCISIVYVWIATYIRNTSRATAISLATNQRLRNQRDFTVIKRIVVLVSILVALRFPTIIFMIYAVIIGHLYPFTFGIVGLITSVCMIFIGSMIIHITPQLRNNFFVFLSYHDNRIHTQQTLQQRLTVPSTTNGNNPTIQQKKSATIPRQATIQ